MKQEAKNTVLGVLKQTANATYQQIQKLTAQHAELVKTIEEVEQEKCEK